MPRTEHFGRQVSNGQSIGFDEFMAAIDKLAESNYSLLVKVEAQEARINQLLKQLEPADDPPPKNRARAAALPAGQPCYDFE